MPRGDGTGPRGLGAMTGRGMGFCTGMNMVGRGLGLGLGLLAAGRGFRRQALGRGAGMGWRAGRGMGYGFRGGYLADPIDDIYSSRTQKELLEEEKSLLERRLGILNKQLKRFSETDE